MADDSKIYNKVITIESKEESKTTNGNTMVKITDHTGEKFSFFKKKKDGTSSQVAEQFKDMRLDEGSTVKIGYVIESYQDKKGVTRESHKIINFQETNDNPSQTAPQGKTSNGEAPIASERLSEAEFSRRLGVQGHVNALLSNPNVWDYPSNFLAIPELVKKAIGIEDEINKQLNPSKGWQKAIDKFAKAADVPGTSTTLEVMAEELPTIQQDEDVPPLSDEDIPF